MQLEGRKRDRDNERERVIERYSKGKENLIDKVPI